MDRLHEFFEATPSHARKGTAPKVYSKDTGLHVHVVCIVCTLQVAFLLEGALVTPGDPGNTHSGTNLSQLAPFGLIVVKREVNAYHNCYEMM